MIWVVVSDGGIAKIFSKEHIFSPLVHLKTIEHPHELTHEHGRDKPGRAFESAAPIHHAYEPKNDWHEQQKELFIKEISTYLLKAYENNSFSKLYFICSDKLIPIFKQYFQEKLATQQLEHLEIIIIHKDLTHSTLHEIEKAMGIA